MLKIVCSDCRGRLRMTDLAGVAACTRCGALWLPDGDTRAIGDWFRHAVQVRATMALHPTRVRYGEVRDLGEHSEFAKTILIVVAALAFFIIMGPLNGGWGTLLARVLGPLLGAAGVGLVLYGVQFPSRRESGALSPRGFGWVLAGILFGILAVLAWN